MAKGERTLLESPNRYTPAGLVLRPYTPDVLLEGGETIEVAGISFDVVSVPGHSPAHLAYYADESLFSGDVLFAGSVGRTDLPGADWDTLLASIRSLVDAYPPETVVYPGHGPTTTLGRRARAEPVPRRASRGAGGVTRSAKIERPRGTHDIVPAEQPLWRRVVAEAEELCRAYGYDPVQTPVFEDTALFERTSGAGSDVVQKEMYTFEDRSGRSLTLASRGDRADLPSVRRARPAPGAATREAVHDRFDVSVLGARSAAASASTGSSRWRRSAPTTPRSMRR